MSKRYIYYFIFLLLSFVSPLCNFFFVIYFVNNISSKLYPLFLGVLVYHLSVLFQPTDTYDYYRHLERLELDMSLNEIITYYVIQSETNFIFPVIAKFFVTLSLGPKTALALISAMTTFIIAQVSEKYNFNNGSLSRIIVCLGLSYISILSGMRYMLALSFLITAFYFKDKNKLKTIFFVALACGTHLTTLIAVPLLLLDSQRLKLSPLFLILGLVISPVLIEIIFVHGISVLSSMKSFSNYVDLYIAEVDSFERHFLWAVLRFSIVIVFVKQLRNKYIDKSFLYLLSVILIFINYPIILDRFILLGIVLGIFPNLNTFLKKDQLLIVSLLLIRFTIEAYDNLEVYSNSFLNRSLILNF